MKINNKGMTLVELIISIGLLSIVLGFLYKILLDVKYEKDNSGFAANNQINRSELIRTVEEDFLYLNENGIFIESYDISGNVLTLYFSEEKNKAIVVSNDKKSITYNAPEESDKKSWDLADNDYTFGDIVSSVVGNCYITFTIPVLNNIDDGSRVDDIELITKYKNCP